VCVVVVQKCRGAIAKSWRTSDSPEVAKRGKGITSCTKYRAICVNLSPSTTSSNKKGVKNHVSTTSLRGSPIVAKQSDGGVG
jgi:hypothetical protein